jgi:hypothetical protein
MSAQENYPGGITLEDGIKAAKIYASAGIDALDISQGCYGAMPYTVPPYFLPERVNVYNASRIKKNVDIPVMSPVKYTRRILPRKYSAMRKRISFPLGVFNLPIRILYGRLSKTDRKILSIVSLAIPAVSSGCSITK